MTFILFEKVVERFRIGHENDCIVQRALVVVWGMKWDEKFINSIKMI